MDDEIEELRKLMEKLHKPRYCELKQKANNMIHMTSRVYINKEGGEFQHKVWNLERRENKTIKQKQRDKTTDLLQVKVWDP